MDKFGIVEEPIIILFGKNHGKLIEVIRATDKVLRPVLETFKVLP